MSNTLKNLLLVFYPDSIELAEIKQYDHMFSAMADRNDMLAKGITPQLAVTDGNTVKIQDRNGIYIDIKDSGIIYNREILEQYLSDYCGGTVIEIPIIYEISGKNILKVIYCRDIESAGNKLKEYPKNGDRTALAGCYKNNGFYINNAGNMTKIANSGYVYTGNIVISYM